MLKASVVGGVEDVEVQMLTCDVTVLTGRLGEFGSDAVRLADEPDADWLAAYTGHRSGGGTPTRRDKW